MQNAILAVIVAVLSLPLIVNWPRVAGCATALLTLFLLGFAGPFLDRTGHIALIVVGLVIIIATPIAVGRFARSGGTAFVAGAAFVPLIWLAVGYGIYLARETGWHGLTPLGRPTSDQVGIGVIWFVFIGLVGVWFIGAAMSGLLATWVRSRYPGRPPQL